MALLFGVRLGLNAIDGCCIIASLKAIGLFSPVEQHGVIVVCLWGAIDPRSFMQGLM